MKALARHLRLLSVFGLALAVNSIASSAFADPLSGNATENNGHAKVGLALGGGGTRGCAHVGVLRVLQEAGIPIDFIVGTSMGSAVGGLYAGGLSPDQIEKKLVDKSISRAYDTVPLKLRFALTPVFFVPRALGHHSYEGLYRGGMFAEHIDKCLPGSTKIEDFKIPFYAVSCDLLSGKPYIIRNGCLGKALQATCAIPVLRRPIVLDDKLLMDAGLICNVPVMQARELGADIVIAVTVDETIEQMSEENFRHLGSVGNRVTSLMLAQLDSYPLKTADIVIQPYTTGITVLSRDTKDVHKAVAAGEDAARKALPKIREVLMDRGVLARSEPGSVQTAEYRVRLEAEPAN